MGAALGCAAFDCAALYCSVLGCAAIQRIPADPAVLERPAISTDAPAATPWLVCRIDPRVYELWLSDCAAAGISAYVPTVVEIIRPHRFRGSQHVHERVLPAFPGGYAFVSEDGVGPDLYRARGWRRFILASGAPVALRPGQIERMQRQELIRHQLARYQATTDRFVAGDEVRIVDHLWLEGSAAVVARTQSSRSAVLVHVDGWDRPIELHPCVVRRVDVSPKDASSDDDAEIQQAAPLRGSVAVSTGRRHGSVSGDSPDCVPSTATVAVPAGKSTTG